VRDEEAAAQDGCVTGEMKMQDTPLMDDVTATW
jgi:hypothetical protein